MSSDNQYPVNGIFRDDFAVNNFFEIFITHMNIYYIFFILFLINTFFDSLTLKKYLMNYSRNIEIICNNCSVVFFSVSGKCERSFGDATLFQMTNGQIIRR